TANIFNLSEQPIEPVFDVARGRSWFLGGILLALLPFFLVLLFLFLSLAVFLVHLGASLFDECLKLFHLFRVGRPAAARAVEWPALAEPTARPFAESVTFAEIAFPE